MVVGHAEEGTLDREVERANHAGHVAQRRSLDASFTDGSRVLPLEVNDDEVLAGEEQLRQMVIAMAANPLAVQRGSRMP